MKVFLMLFVIAALLLATAPASASTSRTPLDITEYVYMKTPGKEWLEGNVYHLRGQIHEAVEVVDGEIWGSTPPLSILTGT
jgi:hypothetical protein